MALATGAKKERYQATIASVTRAAQRDSGALLVCVETLTTLDEREQLHVEVPLNKLAALQERGSLDFGRDAGFDSAAATDTEALRYVFFANQLTAGCPDAANQVPVHSGATFAAAASPGMYVLPAEKGITVRYHSPDPLWSSVRDVDLAPVIAGEKTVQGQGNGAYWLVVPFAALFDGLFFYLYIFG
jgi:hypothetical protein